MLEQIKDMISAYLDGNWPIHPIPPSFAFEMYRASTADEQARVIVKFVTTLTRPAFLTTWYKNTNLRAYAKEQTKLQLEKFRYQKINIPTLKEFSLTKLSEIIRAIGEVITERKQLDNLEQATIERILYLEFHLAGKSFLISQALTAIKNDEQFLPPAWKDILYNVNIHDPSSDYNDYNDAYAKAYTTDKDGNCSGFVFALSHFALEQAQESAHFATKHVLRLLSTMDCDVDDIGTPLRAIIKEVAKEVNANTKAYGITLLAYRAIKKNNVLRIIGFNIGNSTLLEINPIDQSSDTIARARKNATQPHDVLFLSDSFSNELDSTVINATCALDSRLTVVSKSMYTDKDALDTKKRKEAS